jgi:uncharacterized protein YllA (UPF0747 family)
MKKIIKLNESDLHRIIKKLVNKTLNENTQHFNDSVDSCLDKIDATFCNETIIANFWHVVDDFEERINANRNDLSEDQLSQLYDLDKKLVNVAYGLTEIKDSIADLTHSHSVEYYNRYGD